MNSAQNGHRAVIIALEGEFDLAQRDRLADAFAIAGRSDLVVLDLAETSYIDSTVLSQMMQLRNDLTSRSGRLLLVCANRTVRRLLDVSQLAPLFSIHDRVEDVILNSEAAQRITVVSET